MYNLSLTRDLVLVGGGHTHALVLRKWGMKPLPGVRLTVINPGPTAPYSGMLPGFVAGHYTRDELDIDLVQLCRFAGARLINGAADHVDKDAKTVQVPGWPPIAYDVLSIDVGITSDMPKMAGFAAHAIPAKPLGTFASRWDAFRQDADHPQIAIIGGGVAGAELAMAMSYALRDREPLVQLIDRQEVLRALGAKARRLMLEALRGQGVELIENAEVTGITSEGVNLADGRLIPSNFTTGAAGAKPHDWIAGIGVETHDGFICVDRMLRSSDEFIYAVGDCAHMRDNPRPKAGVYAVRQAPVLYDNLCAVMSGRARMPYVPQNDYLKLISLGEKSALAEKFGTARQGPLLWKLKDHIDRKFMKQFVDLPVMNAPKIPSVAALGMDEALGGKPMCGGCGAKVGRGALGDVLNALPPGSRDDIEAVPGDDAAVIITGRTRQVMTTDHLSAVTLDPAVMARIAAVHALGDIWAMGAKPQAATASIILPRMNADLQRRTLSEVMAVATEVMDAAGAAIVGGHSSMGDNLTIGFTLTGLCKQPITIDGAQPGDALILTKPIGSGVIMAAEMAQQARGADVVACLEHMTAPQGQAGRILAKAHAMTDVTGFGLAGHLANICTASGTGAVVRLSGVPVMQGALTLAGLGVRSTLFADNRAGAGMVLGPEGPVSDLLFDPQTAGGLLAVVAADSADALLTKLRRADYPAVIIGQMTEGNGIVLES